jgi:hypothetical protein
MITHKEMVSKLAQSGEAIARADKGDENNG